MQIKKLTARVTSIRRETPDTVTIALDRGGEPFDYKAGQAVGIDPHQFAALADDVARREAERGRPEMERSYSLASHPAQTHLELTVKEEPIRHGKPPLLSPYLVRRLREGDEITINGPFGLYSLPDDLGGLAHAVHICAGSGIVPSRAVINDSRARGLPLSHTLLFQNRTSADIIYRDELDACGATVVHVLSRPDDGWTERRGYITRELVAEHITDPARTIGFACGPNEPRGDAPGFLDFFTGNRKAGIAGVLQELGLDRKRIKKESW